MAGKPTYEELEQRVKELEKVSVERKQAEDALRENEEKYRTLVEGLEDVIVSFSLDGTILYCSPNVNNFGGYDSKEEIGHHFSKYIADEEVKQELQEFFQRIIKRKKTITFAFRYMPKSKDPFYVEAKASPIINEKTDEIVSIQCIVRDITERKQAEDELRKYRDHLEELVEERTAELREIEERFSAFMDYLPAIVFIKDENYRMEYMNKHMRDVLGTDDSWMGRTILEIFGDTDLARKVIADDKIALSAGFELKEESVSGATGTERLYETRKFRIDRKGKSPLLGGIALDITERKLAEEKVKEHHKNIELLSKTAMKFVEFPADKNIYNFIGEQLRELIGKDSYIVINTINEEKSILITRAVLGIGKFTDKIAKLLGRHPVGMTFDAKDETLSDLSDGKLHLNKEGLYGILLKTVPKTVCNSLEKLLNIKKIYGIGFTKDNQLFGTVIIFLKENAGELKNKQIIEAFLKQASIAVQKGKAEEALRESEEKFRYLVKNSNDVFVIIDENGKEIFVSDSVERITGFTPAETMGRSGFEFLHPDDVDHMSETLSKLLETPGGTIRDEYRHWRKGGGWVHLEAIGANYLHKPSIKGIVLNVRDITERTLVEETLRESEEKYRSLVESTEDYIYLVDRNCAYMFMNKEYLSKFGMSEDKVIGRRYDEFHSKDETKEFRGRVNAVIKTGESSHYVYESERVGGHYLRTLSPVKDLKGNIVAVTVVSKDITERKQAEEELRESEQKFRNLADSSPSMVFVYQAGKVVYANQVCRDLMGYTIEEYLSPDFTFLCLIAPESLELIKDKLSKHMQGKEVNPYEYVLLTKDGERLNAIMTSRLIDYQGESAILGIITDITERKRTEEALRDSRHMLQTVLDSTPTGIFWKDRDSIYLGGNLTWLEAVGLKSSEEVAGKSDYELPWDKKQADSFREDDRRVMESGIPEYDIIEPYLQADGTHAWAKTNKVPLRDTEDNVVGVLGTYEDITERKQTEEQLRRSNEVVLKEHNQRRILSKRLIDLLEKDRRQIAMELHDHIGQTLTSLKMDIEMIHGKLKPEHGELGARITAAQERTIQAIKDVKNISRGLRPGMLDALGLVPSLRELFNEIQRQTDIEIRFFSRNIPKRLAPERELAIYRIAQEALTNIIRHAKAKNVFVNLVKKDDNLSLSAEDDGVGFDQDKVMSFSKKKGPLGILIMRERAEQLDGDFTLESQIGKGTHLLAEIPI